ncbi:MAG: membrane protein insertase YidC [Streptococcaceae bacterium]|nr:membrane protein insertase YidC [Streptococcaceae bacterium]
MKNSKKKLTLAGISVTALLLLSGCVQTHVVNGVRVPTQAATHGLTYNLLVRPMSGFVDLFAHNLGLGYGWGIILVTLIIRFLILPLGLNQAYKSTYMQEKTAYLAPVFAPLNERLKSATTSEEKMAAQQALMKAQKDNGINMLASIGCLPMLIQWPFFIALYNAAAYTQGISNATFFGIPLGHPSIILTIISGVLYFLQTWISTFSMTPEQKKTGMMMLIMSPAMIVIFSFMSPAGVALYWAVGGFVIVIQQVIITFIMKPRMRRKIDEEFTKNPPKINDEGVKDVTPTSVQENFKAITSERNDEERKKGGRNAGKQNRK